MNDWHDCRFTDGPLYWRKGRRGRTLRLRDSVQEFQIVGLTRPMRAPWHEWTAAEFEADMKKNPLAYRIGVYRRVAPDRFRWAGWSS